jgi:hypothetical protein
LCPWAFANLPLLGAKRDLRRGVVRRTLERGKKVAREVVGGVVTHFMDKKRLSNSLFARK